MKKGVKIVIFVAIGMVVLGMGMAFVAMASGGFDMKKLASTKNYMLKTYDVADTFVNINLDIDSESVKVVESYDDNTHFECYESSSDRYDVKVDGDTLKVKSIRKPGITEWFSFGVTEPAKLYLPKEEYEDFTAKLGSGSFEMETKLALEDVDIKVGSGSIRLGNLQADDIVANTNSGSIKADQITAKSADLHSGSGSVKCSNCEIQTQLKASSNSGSITAEEITCSALDLKSGSGSINATNVECDTDFTADTSSGSVNMDNVVSKNTYKAKAGSGSVKINSCDGADMDLQSGSGSIKGTVKSPKMFNATSGSGSVKVPDDDANGGKLVAHTGSGSVNIELDIVQ